MYKFILFLILTFVSSSFLKAQTQGEVPKDLKGCMVALDHFLSQEEQKKFMSHSESDLTHAYNLTLGSYVRSLGD